jgi:hypothetical protein
MNTTSKQPKSNNDHTLTENEFEDEDSNDYESKQDKNASESSKNEANPENKQSET